MDRTCRAGSSLSGKKNTAYCLPDRRGVVGYGILCGAAGRDVIIPTSPVEAVDLGGMTREGPGRPWRGRAGSSLDETRGVVFTVSTRPGEIQTVEVPLSSVAIDYAATRRAGLGRGAGRLVFGAGRLVSQVLNQGSEIYRSARTATTYRTIWGPFRKRWAASRWPQLGGQPGTDLVLVKHPRQQSGSAGHRGPDLRAPGRERHRHPLRGMSTVDIRLGAAAPGDPGPGEWHGPDREAGAEQRLTRRRKFFKRTGVGVSFGKRGRRPLTPWIGAKALFALTIRPAHGHRGRPLRSALSQDTLGSCTTNIAGTVNRVGKY